MTLDAATITAGGTALAAIIAAIAGIVKIVVTRPRLPVAEELLEQLDELRADLLAIAKWAHHARAMAAAEGFDLPDPPDVLVSAGHRDGERQAEPARHGWRSSVTAQTGEQPAVTEQSEPPARREEFATWPDRRRPRVPPPNGK